MSANPLTEDDYTRLLSDAHAAAAHVLEASGRDVEAVVLLAEIDHQGITIVTGDETRIEDLATILAEASWRAAGAGPQAADD